MMDAQLRDHYTADPEAFALATMGKVARDAADTWTVQEWASLLATKAPPRDYVGQLRELYRDILHRWRYVQEGGERVPATPRALLGHVLGAAYNRGPNCPHPERCDLFRTTWRQRGWGDCDDVAALTAAGALALGMRPLFRIVRWPGGAHVSTSVQTPRGELVNLDPVGEPDHPFGWKLEPPGASVSFVDMEGRRTGAPGGGMVSMLGRTYLSGLGAPQYFDRPHMVLVRPGDMRGPRVLGIPTWHAKLLRRGLVEDMMPAVDQFGDVYRYISGADVWAPVGACIPRPMGRWKLFRRIGRRLKKLGRRIRRGFAKFARFIRKRPLFRAIQKGASRLLRSKLVQNIAARALQAFGVPPAATKAVLQREAEIFRKGGRIRMAELVASGKLREAAKIAIDATKSGLRRGAQALVSPLGNVAYVAPYAEALAGWEDDPHELFLEEGGREYPVAMVAGFERIRGWHAMGQLDVTDTPTPGRYYRIKKGDTFFGVVGKAFGLGPGPARLKKAQMVNAVQYNRRFHVKAPAGEAGFWKATGGERISFNPDFACDPVVQATQNGGPDEQCFAIIYMSATGEEPPPFEPPPPPDEPIIEPEEPEEPTIEVPPEEPPPPEPEEPPPVEPEEPEPPAPPIEPVGPFEPEKPIPEPPILPPEPQCGPGEIFDVASGRCVPHIVIPDEPVTPGCPPGQVIDPTTGRCVLPSVEPEEPLEPEEPEPIPEPEPEEPVIPEEPRPTPREGFPWLLVGLVGGAVVGVPVPLLAAGAFFATRESA